MKKELEKYNDLTHTIIGCAIEVNKLLGPGLLESAYQKCLKYELQSKGLKVNEELLLPISYKGIEIDHGYRIDLLVEDTVVLELKTVESLNDVHEAQILTYLKLGNYPIGYLLNFNVKRMMNGVRRYVL
jgi:GxxExxY protein